MPGTPIPIPIVIPAGEIWPVPFVIPPDVPLPIPGIVPVSDMDPDLDPNDPDNIPGNFLTLTPSNANAPPVTATASLSIEMAELGLLLAFAAATAPPPGPTPTRSVNIMFDTASDDGTVQNQWVFFDSVPGVEPDVCTFINDNGQDLIVDAGGSVSSKNPPFPNGGFTFTTHGEQCEYSGTDDVIGTLVCDNGSEIVSCGQDPNFGSTPIECLDSDTLGISVFQPQIICNF
jgi:hypothetical protein